MKGYLQRIAATAASPQPALHPLVGSIFRQTSRDAGADTLPLIEEFAGSEEFGQSPTRTDSSELPADHRRRGEPVAQDGLEETPAAARPIEDQGFQPLMPPSPVTARFPVIADQSAGREAAVNERASADALQQQPPDMNFLASARAGRADGPDPGQAGAAAETERPPVQLVRATLAGQARQAQDSVPAEFSARPPAAEREANDIQIHIGRVEVVAVPQAAPSRATAPARKAISLEDYLRRRDGRGG
jgi:hypothetical protein